MRSDEHEHEQESPDAAGWLDDDALEAMSRTCEDCTASPYEPCHLDCSSRWE